MSDFPMSSYCVYQWGGRVFFVATTWYVMSIINDQVFEIFAILRTAQNGRQFPDGILNACSSMKTFVLVSPINNNSASVQAVNWLRTMMSPSNATFSALLALCAENSPVTGEFPSQWPVTRSFDAFFDLRLHKRSSKQSACRWFETQWCLLGTTNN